MYMQYHFLVFFEKNDAKPDLSDGSVLMALYEEAMNVLLQTAGTLIAECWPKLMAAVKDGQAEEGSVTVGTLVKLAPVIEPAKAQEEQCCSVVEARAHL